MRKSAEITAIVAMSILALDQITKFLARRFLEEPVEMIDGFFKLMLYKNTGIAFSLSLPQSIIITLTYLMLFFGIYLAYRELDLGKKSTQIWLGMVAGGAIGNLTDRMIYGAVTDFLAIANYPVFNVADIGVTVGLFCIVIFYDKIKKSVPKKSSPKKPNS